MNEMDKDLLAILFISVFIGIIYFYYCYEVYNDTPLNNFLTTAPLLLILTLPIIIFKYVKIERKGGI